MQVRSVHARANKALSYVFTDTVACVVVATHHRYIHSYMHVLADMASTETESTLARVKELIAQGPHDERLAARIVPELMMHGSRDEAAALIAEFSRQMEEIAALRRDLETRQRQLVQLVSLVLR